jgi:diguanylate cyclase (GGDEF)-like protein/PAS domain S-box-containing protein
LPSKDFEDFADDEPTPTARIRGISQPTETIDLDNLFTRDLTSSGSFSVKGIRKTSFAKLLLALPMPALLVDASFHIAFANEAWGRISKGSHIELEGKPFAQLFAGHAEASAFETLLAGVYAERKPKVTQGKLFVDNKTIWARIYFRPVRVVRERFILILVEDLTVERRQIVLLDGIRRAKREWERTFDAVPDMICTIDEKYRVTRLNKAMAVRVGASIQDAIGKPCYALIHGTTSPPSFCPQARVVKGSADCGVNYYEKRLSAHFQESLAPFGQDGGSPSGCVIILRDVSEREDLVKRVQYHESFDRLTGVYNRKHFLELLEAAFQTTKRYGPPLTVCFLNIDHFRDINDNYGDKSGDEVLARFGEILRSQLRRSDVCGRYGGDEFAAAMPHTEASRAVESMERVRAMLEREEFVAASFAFNVTCTVGIAEFKKDLSLDALLAQAQRAMAAGKEKGRNTVVVFQ